MPTIGIPSRGLSMPKTDKQYQQEYDAQTLAQAEQIREDPSRLKGAQSAALRLNAQAQKEAEAMSKVAAKKDPVSIVAKVVKRSPAGPATSIEDILKVAHR